MPWPLQESYGLSLFCDVNCSTAMLAKMIHSRSTPDGCAGETVCDKYIVESAGNVLKNLRVQTISPLPFDGRDLEFHPLVRAVVEAGLQLSLGYEPPENTVATPVSA